MDNIDLSDFFITKAQANDFATRLNAIVDMMYTTNFDLEKALMHELGIHKKDAFMKLLRENKMSDASHSAMQDFLKKMQETITSLPVVSLTIAFEPSEETLKALSQWFLTTRNKQVLFDILTDEKLIAGAIITSNGKFKDYSIRKDFDRIIRSELMKPAPSAA